MYLSYRDQVVVREIRSGCKFLRDWLSSALDPIFSEQKINCKMWQKFPSN